MPVLGDLPSTEVPSGENLPNPVIMPDVQFSKDTFNAAMEAEKTTPTETPPETTEPDFPPKTDPKPETKPEPETIHEKGTTDDKKVDAPIETTVSRSDLPEELLTGKKPEPKVDEAVETLLSAEIKKGAKQDAIDNFKALREYSAQVIKERNDRIAELEAKSGDGSTKAEIESAQERVKLAESKASELEQTIERIAFTESPKFKRFLNDEQATLANAKAYFEGTEINPEIVEYAARVNGQQRIKILREAGADAELIGAVSPYLAQFDNIQRYKNGALENWKAEQGQFLEQQQVVQQQQVEQRKKAEDEVWSTTVHELKDLVPLRKFEKNDSWNTRADELLQKAKDVYNGDGVDLKTVAEKLIKGQAYDALDALRVTLTEELNKALAENAKLKSARPGASNGQASISNNGLESNLTPEEAAKRRFNTALAAVRGS